MKIATYKRIDDVGGWECIEEVRDFMEDSDRWVRITEPVEVEFTMLPPENTVQKQVDGLNKQKEKARIKHLREMGVLDEKISKLQAITYEPEAA